ncbi:MAG: hypothetical protein LBF84_02045 [Holosporales bacterium]|jgi:hypothetical protein|nr:hypothetical protein [Holosporales bacterium]
MRAEIHKREVIEPRNKAMKESILFTREQTEIPKRQGKLKEFLPGSESSASRHRCTVEQLRSHAFQQWYRKQSHELRVEQRNGAWEVRGSHSSEEAW